MAEALNERVSLMEQVARSAQVGGVGRESPAAWAVGSVPFRDTAVFRKQPFDSTQRVG
jgi:hypothetical protein